MKQLSSKTGQNVIKSPQCAEEEELEIHEDEAEVRRLKTQM